MSIINILHFSDIHWHPGNRDEQIVVRDAMIEDINLLKSQGQSIDLALFTGDLVLAGENKDHFGQAHKEILEPILEAANITSRELFICPGNHDISRKSVRSADFIEAGLRSRLTSVEEVNAFLKKYEEGDANAALAFGRFKEYHEYVEEYYDSPDHSTKAVNIYNKNIRGVSVAIAAFDNSWRSTGESGGVDRGNLIMGERSVDFAIGEVREADLAIAIFHHPMSWLADFDALSISTRLNKGFDLLAFGHVHTSEPEVKATVNGSSIISQSGSFYAGRKYYNGYQLLSVDTKVCQAQVKLRTYFDQPARRFGAAENISQKGEATFEYRPARGKIDPKVELALREIRPEIRRMALEQFNISDIGAQICSDPHTAFICPPIYVEVSEDEKPITEDASNPVDDELTQDPALERKQSAIDAQDILKRNTNFLLIGGREAGKTSLAHYLAVLASEGECVTAKIPLVIDYNEFKGNLYSLKRLAAAYLGTLKSGFDIEQRLESGDLLFIVDNYSGKDMKKREGFIDLIERYPGTRWILLSNVQHGALRNEPDEREMIQNIEVARIDRLPRRSIRAITQRWCERTGADSEETFSTVMAQIRSSDLPRTGYIVTLLLWALHQNKIMERINESVLIMNMADYLLGKADFRSSLDSEFDATSKEITLQSLAVFLKENGGLEEPNAVTQFLIEFFREKGLGYDAGKILATLVDCGLLSNNGDFVKFKYKCFQEYFHAKHLGSSSKRLAEAYLNRAYLKNSREIEILSGLARENDEVLSELKYQISNYSPESVSELSLSKFNDVIEEESSVGISRRKLRKIRRTKLTPNQVDDLMDAAEARLSNGKSKPSSELNGVKKPNLNKDDNSNGTAVAPLADSDPKSQPPMSVGQFLVTLSLLGKVIRNSEFASREAKIEGVRLYGQSSARFFLLTYEVVSEVFSQMVSAVNKDESTLDEEAIRGIHYFLTKRLMLFIQGRMARDLASSKLNTIMEDILASGDMSAAERTFLVALQLDCPNPNWDVHWKEHVKEFKKYRVSTEFLADKLWDHIHSKALSAKEHRKVEATAAELEIALGQPKSSKGKIMQSIRNAKQKGDQDDMD